MDSIIAFNQLTASYVYVIIFLCLFAFGYGTRAEILYKQASEELGEKTASFAWYPLAGTYAMAKLADYPSLSIMITSVVAFIGIVLSAVIMVIKSTVIWPLVAFCVLLYFVYGFMYSRLLEKYMNKYSPDTSSAYIIFASFVPLFKYFIHIDFSDKNENEDPQPADTPSSEEPSAEDVE